MPLSTVPPGWWKVDAGPSNVLVPPLSLNAFAARPGGRCCARHDQSELCGQRSIARLRRAALTFDAHRTAYTHEPAADESGTVQELQDEDEQLKQVVWSQATNDQAIGVVIALGQLSPDDAGKVLRNVSVRTNTKLRDVPQQIVWRGAPGAYGPARRPGTQRTRRHLGQQQSDSTPRGWRRGSQGTLPPLRCPAPSRPRSPGLAQQRGPRRHRPRIHPLNATRSAASPPLGDRVAHLALPPATPRAPPITKGRQLASTARRPSI
ncbi:ANTAR domain-containing protein [Streptomyces sp. NPDC051214]|uniref:ANTAR domain-containing protein n=1 Tax=Streptomyces sp. NPDC051214 TaxID=3155282 RepID=UPI003442B194